MHPFMRQINIISRCATMYRDRALSDTGLAGCHTPYIMALYRIPGCTQEELARDLNVNKSSVARQLAVLEERGFIRREPSPEDRRSLLVFPTDKALALRPRIHQVLHEWNAYLTQELTAQEQEILPGLICRVADRAERYVKGGDAPCGLSDNT